MKIKSGFKIILLLFATLGITASASSQGGLAQSNWPMFQRNPRHTGQSDFAGITTMPIETWITELPCNGGESATGISQASNGTVYVSACGNLSAVNPENGSIIWTVIGQNNSQSTPAVGADGKIYWGYEDTFAIVDPSGQIYNAWSNLDGNLVFGSSPAIGDDGSIYFNHDGLYAYPAHWKYPFNWYSHSSPAIGMDGTIYVGTVFGGLYAFTPNGEVKWRGLDRVDDGSPSIGDDGTIYIGGAEATLYAYNPDGTLRWAFKSNESNSQDSASANALAIGIDGTIYFGTGGHGPNYPDSGIYAVNPDGTLKWRFPIHAPGDIYTPSWVIAPLLVDRDNNVFACSDNGACYGLAPDGTVLWEYWASHTFLRTAPFIVSDGKMLILRGGDELVSLVAATRQYFPLIMKSGNP